LLTPNSTCAVRIIYYFACRQNRQLKILINGWNRQPERQIVAELIREKALRLLNDEIPHGIAVSIDRMKDRPGSDIVDIDATIVCERDSHKGIIIGKKGEMLKRIGSGARMEMENLLDMHVNLQLWVKVKKDWRDSDFLIKNYGYDKRDI
jgi:GTP-binding protein Era